MHFAYTNRETVAISRFIVLFVNSDRRLVDPHGGLWMSPDPCCQARKLRLTQHLRRHIREPGHGMAVTQAPIGPARLPDLVFWSSDASDISFKECG